MTTAFFIVSGILLGISLCFEHAWFLAVFGIGLYIAALQKTLTYQHVCLGSWITWFIKSSIILSWIFYVYPSEIMGIASQNLQLLTLGTYWLIFSSILGLGGVFFGFFYHLLRQRIRGWFHSVIGGLLWCAAEYCSALLLAITQWGPGSNFDLSYGVGFIGYILAKHGVLLWLATVAGVYALSITTYWLGEIFYQLLTKKRLLIVLVLGLCIAITSPVQLPLSGSHESNHGHLVAVLNTKFLPADTFEHAQIATALQSMSHLRPTHIILPEDSRLTIGFGGTSSTLQLLESTLPYPTILIDSGRTTTMGKTALRAYVFDTGIGQVYWFDKKFLVPNGEYIPYIFEYLFNTVPLSDRVKKFLSQLTYRPGISQTSLSLPERIPPVLFCFESTFPYAVHDLIKSRDSVPFVAHIVSHAWFATTPQTLWTQLDSMLQIQAVKNRTVIIQSANRAPTKVYYPNGDVVLPRVIDLSDKIGYSLISI